MVSTAIAVRVLPHAVLAAGVLLGGCARDATARYPEQWSRPTAAAGNACPRLAGRYHDAGELAAGTPCDGTRHQFRGQYRCDTSLARNLGDIDAGDWVELRQPDADTLVIVSSDPTAEVREWHRSRGDFSCGEHGLERTLHASLMSVGDNSASSPAPLAAFNGAGTLFDLATSGSAGVRTLTRTFSATADGSLIMDVSSSQAGLMVLIPFHIRDEGYVRWSRAEPSPEAAAIGAAAAGASDDLPAMHFARFESMNDFVHKIRLTNVDGTAVQKGSLEARPVALTPGRRWLQISMIDHRWHPLRDFDAHLGFELEAAAGHVYRIGGKPGSCLPPGDVDAAISSHQVSHVQVSLLDSVAGQPDRHFEAQALCIVGVAVICDAADAPTIDMDRVRLSCVRLGDSTRGYYGRVP